MKQIGIKINVKLIVNKSLAYSPIFHLKSCKSAYFCIISKAAINLCLKS